MTKRKKNKRSPNKFNEGARFRPFAEQESYLKSINKFLLRKELVTKENPLRIGSKVSLRLLVDYIGGEETQLLEGYCVGAHKGARGPALLFAPDKETHRYAGSWRGNIVEGIFGYRLDIECSGASHVFIADWQNIEQVTNEGNDLLSLLTNANPWIREMAKRMYELNKDS